MIVLLVCAGRHPDSMIGDKLREGLLRQEGNSSISADCPPDSIIGRLARIARFFCPAAEQQQGRRSPASRPLRQCRVALPAGQSQSGLWSAEPFARCGRGGAAAHRIGRIAARSAGQGSRLCRDSAYPRPGTLVMAACRMLAPCATLRVRPAALLYSM